MNLFVSLLDLLRVRGRVPVIAPEANLGIDESDIQALRDLRGSAGFESLLKLLDAHVKIYSEQLIAPQSRDDATLHEIRGVLIGFRKAAFLVDETLHNADRLTQSRSSSVESERALADARRAALVSTPFFSR